jgi:quinol monooxygenase YgiN
MLRRNLAVWRANLADRRQRARSQATMTCGRITTTCHKKGPQMLIAHLKFSVAAENRQMAIEVLSDQSKSVRNMKGCIAFTPFLDATDKQILGVLHEWDSAEDFAAYLASESFAASGRVLRPLMVSAPLSKRFDAKLIETVV